MASPNENPSATRSGVSASELRRSFLSIPAKEWPNLLREIAREYRPQFCEYVRNASGGVAVEDFMIPLAVSPPQAKKRKVSTENQEPVKLKRRGPILLLETDSMQDDSSPWKYEESGDKFTPGILFATDLDKVLEINRKTFDEKLKTKSKDENAPKAKQVLTEIPIAKLMKLPCEDSALLDVGREFVRKSLYINGDKNFKFGIAAREIKLHETVTLVLDHLTYFCRILVTPVNKKVVQIANAKPEEDASSHQAVGAFWETEFPEVHDTLKSVVTARSGIPDVDILFGGNVDLKDTRDLDTHEYSFLKDARNQEKLTGPDDTDLLNDAILPEAADTEEKDNSGESDHMKDKSGEENDVAKKEPVTHYWVLKEELMPVDRHDTRAKTQKDRTLAMESQEYMSFAEMRGEVGKVSKKFWKLFSAPIYCAQAGQQILKDRIACIVEHALVHGKDDGADDFVEMRLDYGPTLDRFHEWDMEVMKKYNIVDEDADKNTNAKVKAKTVGKAKSSGKAKSLVKAASSASLDAHQPAGGRSGPPMSKASPGLPVAELPAKSATSSAKGAATQKKNAVSPMKAPKSAGKATGKSSAKAVKSAVPPPLVSSPTRGKATAVSPEKSASSTTKKASGKKAAAPKTKKAAASKKAPVAKTPSTAKAKTATSAKQPSVKKKNSET